MGASPKQRFHSVDFLRGLAMAAMVVVNNPGDRRHIYAQLSHAAWDGCTLADFVFPLFLFLVGVCVALAVDRDRALAGELPGLWPKVVRRTAVLFALGLLENAWLHLSFAGLRLPGVLQRIALVYLAAAWLHVRLGNRGLARLTALLLLGYWLVLALAPVPGLGVPSLSREVNLQGWLDQLLLGGHIWKYGTTWDPEGVLSTVPAIGLGLIGVLAGRWLRAGGPGVGRMTALGLGVMAAGLVWSIWFPLNKSLCTSSFVLTVAGTGIALLAVGHRLLDRGAVAGWAWPACVLGRNPLTVYVAASLIASVLRNSSLSDGAGTTRNLQTILYQAGFAAWPDPYLASLAWGLLFLLVMFLGAWALYAKRIVISA